MTTKHPFRTHQPSTHMTPSLWNALIRTHHITSRKKVAKLKHAATQSFPPLFVLLRSGGSPGIMYVEGPQAGVEGWVSAVNRLRYKDYHLAVRPAPVERERTAMLDPDIATDGFFETESVKEFGTQMATRGVEGWWRRGMGYAGDG